jgi:hypothetical protein
MKKDRRRQQFSLKSWQHIHMTPAPQNKINRTSAVMKSIFFWDMTPCSLWQACHLLARWFAELFFDPEDGGDTFLRNVGYNSTDYMASYPRRRYSSKPPL